MSKLYLRRHGAIGYVLYGVSGALIVGGFTGAAAARAYDSALLAWASLAAMLLSPWVYKFARRACLRIFVSYEAIERYLATHGERLFVFLREFASDAVSDNSSSSDYWGSLFVSEEERIASHFRGFGTMIAIGRPGETLPSGGSFRIYAGDDWQSVVGRLLDRADIIVIRLGNTPGLTWELERIIGLGKLDRTIFIPSMEWQKNGAAFERLRQIVELPTLPESPERKRLNESVERLRGALAQRPLDDALGRAMRMAIEQAALHQRSDDQTRVQLGLLATLIRVKDNQLVPIAGRLSDALDKTCHDLGLSPKMLRRLRPWLAMATIFSPYLLFGGSYAICGGDVATNCPVLDQNFSYALIALVLVILIAGSFIIE